MFFFLSESVLVILSEDRHANEAYSWWASLSFCLFYERAQFEINDVLLQLEIEDTKDIKEN